jgi:2-C-methyl-D-erythritol 4-phosphate cytidylyltransferase/2-C-methyl-D-erythritol 2,4-cyclodiphosphate synthase
MRVTAIIAAGGSGRRVGGAVPKQLLDLGGRSVLARSVGAFDAHPSVSDLIVALPPDLVAGGPSMVGPVAGHVRFVAGGTSRQDSVALAFDEVPNETDVVLVHDAARPFVSEAVITRAIEAAAAYGAAIAGMPVSDTVKRVAAGADPIVVETLPREAIFLAQTPQAFRRDVLGDAVALGRTGVEATDEAGLAERAGHEVRVVAGEAGNVKITTAADLEQARARAAQGAVACRAGLGYDLHRLVEGRPLILGGVTIPSSLGALGHSDADAACHAATDAILGGACLGDIGRHFPDNDPQWKGASSVDLLRRAAQLVRGAGFVIDNVDVVVILERPRISPFVERIRQGLADALGIDVGAVSVKGKSNEGVDAVGRGEAIAAHAVAMLRPSSARDAGAEPR